MDLSLQEISVLGVSDMKPYLADLNRDDLLALKELESNAKNRESAIKAIDEAVDEAIDEAVLSTYIKSKTYKNKLTICNVEIESGFAVTREHLTNDKFMKKLRCAVSSGILYAASK